MTAQGFQLKGGPDPEGERPLPIQIEGPALSCLLALSHPEMEVNVPCMEVNVPCKSHSVF